jgi:L-serine dehydratase
MAISVFDIFSIGIGPSSSHTIGPMRAGYVFAAKLHEQKLLDKTQGITIELFGSLALTGKGHCTDMAILMGLEGHRPQFIEPKIIKPRLKAIAQTKTLSLLSQHPVTFDIATQLIFRKKDLLPLHPNGMRFTALDKAGKALLSREYYSIGGGFIINGKGQRELTVMPTPTDKTIPYPFSTANELFDHCRKNNLKIHEVMLENEKTWRSKKEIYRDLITLYRIMKKIVKRGAHTSDMLPGGLNLQRRAPALRKSLKSHRKFWFRRIPDMQWLQLYALAASEENAGGGRTVTAPTNGSAGIIPAVLLYYKTFHAKTRRKKIIEFLLTAGAIGILYKLEGSISGAEVGCQGEVGVACSMAAAALTSVFGGNLEQIEDAAKIAMEHHLGLTCDPIQGLVQIPCIERNAIAAVTAVNVTNLVLIEHRS